MHRQMPHLCRINFLKEFGDLSLEDVVPTWRDMPIEEAWAMYGDFLHNKKAGGPPGRTDGKAEKEARKIDMVFDSRGMIQISADVLTATLKMQKQFIREFLIWHWSKREILPAMRY